MNFENGEFQFAVELIIANRNETGATLSDIRGLCFLCAFKGKNMAKHFYHDDGYVNFVCFVRLCYQEFYFLFKE